MGSGIIKLLLKLQLFEQSVLLLLFIKDAAWEIIGMLAL